jgi:hypothetical protein
MTVVVATAVAAPTPAAPSIVSRLLTPLKAFALAFAASEVAAAVPHVQKALDEVAPDLKAADPVAALLMTAQNAWVAMKADPAVVPSFTGLMGALASAFI